MSMCDRLKGVANFDEAMFLLERRQPGATGSQALPGLQIFKISKNSSRTTKGEGSLSMVQIPPIPPESLTSLAALSRLCGMSEAGSTL